MSIGSIKVDVDAGRCSDDPILWPSVPTILGAVDPLLRADEPARGLPRGSQGQRLAMKQAGPERP
eukprot:3763468-Pyramimonas_sp.AAC.1